MTDVYLVEPEPSPAWFPFADCRPISEMRAGIWLIRERWEAIGEGETRAIFAAPHLHLFGEDGVPLVTARKAIEGPALIGKSDFAPAGTPPEFPEHAARLTHEGATVGWWVPQGDRWDADHDEWPAVEIDGLRLHGAHDLVTALETLFTASGDQDDDMAAVIRATRAKS